MCILPQFRKILKLTTQIFDQVIDLMGNEKDIIRRFSGGTGGSDNVCYDNYLREGVGDCLRGGLSKGT